MEQIKVGKDLVVLFVDNGESNGIKDVLVKFLLLLSDLLGIHDALR